MTLEQKELVQAFIFSFGLVPANLITDSMIKMVHEELYQKQVTESLRKEQKELSDEFLRNCLKHWRFYWLEKARLDGVEYKLEGFD